MGAGRSRGSRADEDRTGFDGFEVLRTAGDGGGAGDVAPGAVAEAVATAVRGVEAGPVRAGLEVVVGDVEARVGVTGLRGRQAGAVAEVLGVLDGRGFDRDPLAEQRDALGDGVVVAGEEVRVEVDQRLAVRRLDREL